VIGSSSSTAGRDRCDAPRDLAARYGLGACCRAAGPQPFNRRTLRRAAPATAAQGCACRPIAGHGPASFGAALRAGSAALARSFGRIDVATQAVQGLATASWRYDPSAHGLRLRLRLRLRMRHYGNLRRCSRAAALDQDVIGDAGVVFVLSMARAAFAADPSGPARGYRYAFLEVGWSANACAWRPGHAAWVFAQSALSMTTGRLHWWAWTGGRGRSCTSPHWAFWPECSPSWLARRGKRMVLFGEGHRPCRVMHRASCAACLMSRPLPRV